MTIVIVPYYAAALTLLYIALTFFVIRQRRSAKSSLGTNGSKALERAVRAHGNFIEYVPLALILMLIAEMRVAHPYILHAVGIALVVARTLHALGISNMNEDFRFRITGMMMTFGVLVVLAILVLIPPGL
jgi:uncharacterized protein